MRWRVLKWKIKNSRLWRRLFPIIALAVLLIPSNTVYAADVSTTFSVYWRSYRLDGAAVVNQEGAFTGSYNNVTLLQYSPGSYKTLYGYSVEFPVSDNTSYQYKTLAVDILVSQGLDNPAGTNSLVLNPTASMLSIGTSSDNGSGTSNACVGSRGDPNNAFVTYHCSITVSNASNRNITSAQAIIGVIQNATADSHSVVGTTCGVSISPECNHDIVLQKVSYTLSGGNDPSYDELTDISAGIASMNDLLEEQQKQDQEDRSNLENQSSDSAASANDAQAQVEDATSSMFDIIRAFNEILGTPASDCVISVQTAGFSLQNMDLCQAPSEIRTMINAIVGLIAVVASVLVSYNLVMSILDLITYAQGGDKKEGGK